MALSSSTLLPSLSPHCASFCTPHFLHVLTPPQLPDQCGPHLDCVTTYSFYDCLALACTGSAPFQCTYPLPHSHDPPLNCHQPSHHCWHHRNDGDKLEPTSMPTVLLPHQVMMLCHFLGLNGPFQFKDPKFTVSPATTHCPLLAVLAICFGV